MENNRDCPFCRESIKADAVKCRYCSSAIVPEAPPHDGTCPFCKEEIKPDAVRCRYCKSDLTLRHISPCDCGPIVGVAEARPYASISTALAQFMAENRAIKAQAGTGPGALFLQCSLAYHAAVIKGKDPAEADFRRTLCLLGFPPPPWDF